MHNQKLFVANTVLSITGKVNKSQKLYSSKNGKNLITFHDLYNNWRFDEDVTDNFSFENVTKKIPKYSKIKEFV